MRRIRDDLDCAIFIIEHDMPMLMGLCDRGTRWTRFRHRNGDPVGRPGGPPRIASDLGTTTPPSVVPAKPSRPDSAVRLHLR